MCVAYIERMEETRNTYKF